MKDLITINKKFVNYILLFLICGAIMLFFISQIKIEKNIDSVMSIDEDKEITLIISSSDAYFINNSKSISFILNDKLYIVDDIFLKPIQNNKFSITINDKHLETILQANSIFKVNINLGIQKLYELFF